MYIYMYVCEHFRGDIYPNNSLLWSWSFLALPYLHIIFYLYNTHGKTYLYLYMPILYKQFVQYIHILIICINIYFFKNLNNVYIYILYN